MVLVHFILTSSLAFAQKTPVPDSLKLYKNIETFSGQRKFTKFMFQMFFRPVSRSSRKVAVKKAGHKLKKMPYSAFEGKIIRKIDINSLDPFGYSINDTSAKPLNYMIKQANATHIKSQGITIRNLLLIHRNQPFDSLLVKESERLVRSQHYVRDLAFFVTPVTSNSDSVDINIREMDKWSLIPKLAASPSSITFNLRDNNFLGLGHEFQAGVTRYRNNADYAFLSNYLISNIRNTFINSSVQYSNDRYRNYTKSVSVDRPFYSPFARWAAGVRVYQQFQSDSVYTSDSLFTPRQYKFNAQDIWFGFAQQLFKGTSEDNRTTNLITSLRFLRIRYPAFPEYASDTMHNFSNEDFYMASIGVSTRKYVQDKFIFRFGITEDIPVGRLLSVTAGYQRKNSIKRLYLGARISFGNYYSFGYLSSTFEYGSFFHASNPQQQVYAAGITYFTNLTELGKWKFRQFIKPQLIIGVDRFTSDSLTLNDGYGLDGFNSSSLIGTKRLLLTFQSQWYSPWSLIGFHFGPFLTCTFGVLGNEPTGFKSSKVYTLLGLGVLIKNENLVINTFQLSFSFFPSIPGKGQDILKANTFRTTDFGVQDFIIGKPGATLFQ
ncbi:MAG: hypothetical protein HXX13_04125 [Bacteroidetes bacterium]|nr:hypothetical protein [Bacteroidota bacterium]